MGMVAKNQILKILLKENHAEDYIQLKGHVNLDDIYVNYELFVSASQVKDLGLL